MDPSTVQKTSRQADERSVDDSGPGAGFSVIDEKGRISLPKRLRQLLGAEPGSSIAYIALDHALLLIPQDAHLASLQQHAQEALARGGLTVENLLDDLPQVRASVASETYGEEFLRELERRYGGPPETPGERSETPTSHDPRQQDAEE
jgi:bifunctional DNA-binding transcriptional regulator/antitoxin component of YhaV-PrlF toxin-antitoxin module